MKICGVVLNQVNKFIYLWNEINNMVKTKGEISRRLQLSSKCYQMWRCYFGIHTS